MNYLRTCHQQQGLTVLLVTHERALADRYAQRILTLGDGRLVDDVQACVARVSDPRSAQS